MTKRSPKPQDKVRLLAGPRMRIADPQKALDDTLAHLDSAAASLALGLCRHIPDGKSGDSLCGVKAGTFKPDHSERCCAACSDEFQRRHEADSKSKLLDMMIAIGARCGMSGLEKACYNAAHRYDWEATECGTGVIYGEEAQLLYTRSRDAGGWWVWGADRGESFVAGWHPDPEPDESHIERGYN